MTLITGQQGGQASQGSAEAGSQNQQQQQPVPITDWRASLPKEYQTEKVFESIKAKDLAEALPELSKQFINAQRMIGADKVVLPTEKSTPEEIAQFRKKLGVPDKPDEYGYKLPEGLTDDKLDKERLTLWRKEMHEAGIPKGAAERLISKFLSEEHSFGQAQEQARVKQLDAYETQVKQEFGAKLDENLNYARWAVKEFGSPELLAMLDETGMGSHPAVVKLLAKVGSQLAEHKPQGGQGGGFGNLSPADAQAALNTFNRDENKQKILFDASHPQHAAIVEERKKLFIAAFPPENTSPRG